MTRSVPLTIAAYTNGMVRALGGPLRPFFHSGDEIDLVSGNHDRPLSVPALNGWATELAADLPGGVKFAAHTSGLDNVSEIAAKAEPQLTSILLDYEPNWDPAFTWEFGTSLVHLDRFSSICHSHGRHAVAYPTGRPIQEPPLQQYNWDYGEIRRHVDEVYPQTQHWTTLGARAWSTAIQRLRSQWVAHGLDPGTLTVQLTIGPHFGGLARFTSEMRWG